MGQSEIQEILENQSYRLISSVEIAHRLKQTSSVVTRALNQMLKYKEVSKTKVDGVYYWKLKNCPPISAQLVMK